VIGYSFHDVYLNNLLLQSVNEDNKKVIIVDPLFSEMENPEKYFQDNIRITQQAKIISSINNITNVSKDRIEILPLKAADFFSQYFEKGAVKLLDKLYEIENEKDPF
jgi:hypothetical protein